MTTRTLEQRCAKRNYQAKQNLMPHVHIVAELQRVARQVRKLERPIDTAGDMVHNAALSKVLALIRKATR
jgi:hypothetical protein